MSDWLPSYRLFTETLMRLCRWTTPHGYEHMLIPMLPTPPHGAPPGTANSYLHGEYEWCRASGNYWVTIPGPNQDVLWTCHLDTVGLHPEHVTLVQRGHMLHSDGKTVLGADDKAGVAIMCMMIRAGVSGTYAFFVGEEVGCIGSKAAADEYKLRLKDKGGNLVHPYLGVPFRACISLDRKGSSDVITHQLGGRCCSDEWAKALADNINKYMVNGSFSPCPNGVFTDSASYMDCIDQCTNLSVGYHGQHGNMEHIDMQHAYELCLALIRLCRNEGIPDLPRDRDAEESDDLWMSGYDYMRYHGGSNRWWKSTKKSKPKVDESSLEIYQTDEKIAALEAKIDALLVRWEALPEGDERDDIENQINDLEWDIEQLRFSIADDVHRRYDSSRFDFNS